MTSMHSKTKPGKQPGKQIQDAVGIWESTAIQHGGKQSISLALSQEAAGSRTLEALRMPEVAARPLRPGSCCFPHASPVSPSGAGKQKTAPKDRSKVTLR